MMIVDRTTIEGVDREIKLLNFRWCIFCNGTLEVWDEEGERLLGRADPYLPLNMLGDHEAFDKQIAELEALKQRLGA